MNQRRRTRGALSPEDLRGKIEIIGYELEDFFRKLRERSPAHDRRFSAEYAAAQGMIEGKTDGAGLLAETLRNPVLGLDPDDLFFDVAAVEDFAGGGRYA